MTVFISGGAKSGKSRYAQRVAAALADGGRLFYLAAMVPQDAEDHERVRRHVADRAGMGFETVECPRDILTAASDTAGTYLLESVTSLLQNSLFPPENGYEADIAAAEHCKNDLLHLAGAAKNVVYVSDYIYSDAERYDAVTETYRRTLADIDRALAAVCDAVIEVSAGEITVHRGVAPI